MSGPPWVEIIRLGIKELRESAAAYRGTGLPSYRCACWLGTACCRPVIVIVIVIVPTAHQRCRCQAQPTHCCPLQEAAPGDRT